MMIHLPDASQTAHQACEQHCSGLDSGVHGQATTPATREGGCFTTLQGFAVIDRVQLSELLTQLCSFHPRFVTILKHQVTSHIRSSHSVEIASKSKVVGLIMIAHNDVYGKQCYPKGSTGSENEMAKILDHCMTLVPLIPAEHMNQLTISCPIWWRPAHCCSNAGDTSPEGHRRDFSTPSGGNGV